MYDKSGAGLFPHQHKSEEQPLPHCKAFNTAISKAAEFPQILLLKE